MSFLLHTPDPFVGRFLILVFPGISSDDVLSSVLFYLHSSGAKRKVLH